MTIDNATSVVVPDKEMASKLNDRLLASGFRTEIVQRKSTWIYTDAQTPTINCFLLELIAAADA